MTKINCTMVTASHLGHSITSNISFYKKIQLQPGKEEWQDSDNMGGDLSDNVADEINQTVTMKYKGGDIHRETGNQPKDTVRIFMNR